MSENTKLIFSGLWVVCSIGLTIFGIFWGMPWIVDLFDSIVLKIIIVLLLFALLPLLPVIPSLLGGLKIIKFFKLYILELADMLYTVFSILIVLPAVAVQIFCIIGAILLLVSFIGIILWIFNHPLQGRFLSGLGYKDLLYYATVFNCSILSIMGSYILYEKLEQGATELGDASASALTVLLNFRKKRRAKIKSFKENNKRK